MSSRHRILTPRVASIDARPTMDTRPTGTRTPIAGREARMHERKTLAGQGGHAPPGTSTALKRRLNLGRPEKGAAAEWETRLGRWKQRSGAVAPAASAEKAHRQGATAGGRAQLARSGGLRRSRLRNARGDAPTASARRDAPGESARKFPPQRRRRARRAKARNPCRQRRTPGRTPQQRDRRRMREERTGARPKRQAHTSAPRFFQGGDERTALTHATPTSEETR